jgi:hypothetical protein
MDTTNYKNKKTFIKNNIKGKIFFLSIMGCRNTKMVKVHNHAFDLIDADGDHKVTKAELDCIADYIHAYHVQQSAIAHNKLATTMPEDYLFEILGKSKTSKLKRKDFNILVSGIPPTLWNTKILPALRSTEINRLRNMSN